jgi:tRNA uridine 5-carboxymethylaminomethyl modification enzyme
MERLGRARDLARSLELSPPEAQRHGLSINQDGIRRNALDLLAYPGIDIARLAAVWPALAALDSDTAGQLENDARYAGYAERQRAAVAAMRRDAACALPGDLDYRSIPGLSAELQEKLARIRPQSLDQAGRIDGMTPAALAVILAATRRTQRRRRA